MDIQEFGAKIVSIFDESSFEKTKKKLESFTKQFESVKVGFELTTNTDKIYKTMKDAYDDIEKQMSSIKKNPKLFVGSPSEQQSLLDALAKLEISAERVKKAMKDGSNFLFRMGEYASKTNSIFDRIKKNSNFSETFKDVTRSTLKWITALVGARSLWTLLRKSMSVYLSQNDELYYKLQSCYYALGSMFAPILEYIVNLFIKLIGYVNIFAKALGFAGISMKSIAKSSGSASKMLAPFDEINNINNSSGGGGGSNPLASFTPDEGWAKAIEWFAALVKEKFAEMIALATGLWLMLKLITNFGVNAMQAGGWGLFISSVLLFLQDTWKFVNNPTWENFIKVLLTLAVAVGALAVAFGLVTGGWALLLLIGGAVVLFFREEIASAIVWIAGKIGEFANFLGQIAASIMSVLLGAGRGLFAMLSAIIKGGLDALVTFFKGFSEGVGLIFQGLIKILNGDFAGGFADIFNGLVTIAKTVFNSLIDIINGALSGIGRAINYVIEGINGIHFTVPSLVPWVGGKTLSPNITYRADWGHIPHLAQGTNYVPNDMLAMIHQGEAVVPKAFNESRFENSEETNDLLRELIEVVGSKEFKAYISQNEVGKSAVKYINQQSRLMGGSLI